MPGTPDFDDSAREAQLEHGRGYWPAADDGWAQALENAPDDSEFGRVWRGRAASRFRWSQANRDLPRQGLAITDADRALDIHDELLRTAQRDPNIDSETMETGLREHAESARVCGGMALSLALTGEHATGGKAQVGVLAHANGLFRAATKSIDELYTHQRQRTGKPQSELPPDQYEINLAPYRALGEAFAPGGSPQIARRFARDARRMAWRSESPELPTSANLGRRYQLESVAKSVVRAYVATAANWLATPEPSLRRRAAVRIATLPGVL